MTLRGLEFALLRWGPEAPEGAPRVLLLHGWLDQAAAWELVAARLAEAGHCVYALDQRGHGRSAWAPPGSYYHFPEYVADVDALWRAWGQPPLLLVGHSMGGTVASLFAGARPEAVVQLTLLEGLGPVAAEDADAAKHMGTWLRQLAEPPGHRPLEDLEVATARLQRFTPSLPPRLARSLAQRVTEPHPEGGLRWTWDPLHRTRAPLPYDVDRHVALLRRITAPTLFLLGTRSWYAGIPDLERRLAAIPERSQANLDAGHALHVEAHAEVSRLLLAAWAPLLRAMGA
ncbi:MAG: alpha/beta fold hydrolase [Alphaproteobacteria bacterium]|nr:alpha/beta fold hydrolase [Alphaproteobacteria bacterium]